MVKRLCSLTQAALVLTLGTFLLCGSEALASEPSPVRYGLNMGLNMGRFVWPETWMADLGRDDRLPQPSMRLGWVAEFFTPKPGISIVTGVDYRMSREKYHVYEEGEGLWTDRMGTYLTVPVLFKYTLKETEGMWPFFDFGPQAAFVLSFSGRNDGPTAMDMEMTQYARRVTMELRGGAGIEFPMSDMFTGVIEAGYEYGLTSFVKESLNLPATARNLSLSMGARF